MIPAFLNNVHADPWSDVFVDLPSLNAEASEALESTIMELRQLAEEQPASLRSVSTVVLGPPGAGKTHLFSRLRRRLGPRAAFVHIRPLVGSEMTPRLVLSEITKQLAHTTNGVPQIDALVGCVLAHAAGDKKEYPRALLEVYRGMDAAQRAERLEAALEHLLERWPEGDESYLRRLLAVPFERPPVRRALLGWLSGRECDAAQLARIGAAASIGEELVMHALKTLAVVAALGAPLVLVFDQLENLIEAQGHSARLSAYATLTSELVDALRGVALVHMALDTEWAEGIEPTLNLAQRSRLIMKRLTLRLPTTRQREDLLRVWLEQLPDPDPYPWPFRESDAARLLKAPGLTPRMLLLAYRGALEGDDAALESTLGVTPAPTSTESAGSTQDETALEDAIDAEWQATLGAARDALDSDTAAHQPIEPERLADGLVIAARFVDDLEIKVQRMNEPAQLRIEGASAARWVALAQQPHHTSLGTALQKLTVLAQREPLLVMREQRFPLAPTWKATLAKQRQLLAAGRARWLELEREDAAQLLALATMIQAARSGDVTDRSGRVLALEQVHAWTRAKLNIASWGPLAALSQTAAEDDAVDAGAPDAVSDDDAARDSQLDTPLGERGASARAPGAAAEDAAGAAWLTLQRLRVASVERLLREVTRLVPSATRSQVLNELEQRADTVRFVGRTLVYIRETA